MTSPAYVIEQTQQLTLADLRRMSFDELKKLYRNARRPTAISDLDGDAIGAMLAWRSPQRGPVAWLLRVFGASSVFPWEGKTFRSQGRDLGEGIIGLICWEKGAGFHLQRVSMLHSWIASPLLSWTMAVEVIRLLFGRS